MPDLDPKTLKERILAAERDGGLEVFLSGRVRASDGLWGVVADITDGCRQGCLTCPAVAPRACMEAGTVEALADVMVPHAEYVAIGCLSEPLLHPGVAAVLRVLRRAKMRNASDAFICLLTASTARSGVGLSEVAGAGLDVLLVSADSTDPDIYAHIRGGAVWAETRTRIRAALPTLAEEGVRIGAQVMLLRCNVETAATTASELGAMGFESVNFTQPTQVPDRAAGEVLRSADPLFEHVRQIGSAATSEAASDLRITLPRRAPDLGERLGARFGDGATWDEDRAAGPGICVAPWFNLRVDVAGRVFPCNYMDAAEDALGDVRTDAFEDIAAGPQARRLREALLEGGAPTAACRACAFCTYRRKPSTW